MLASDILTCIVIYIEIHKTCGNTGNVEIHSIKRIIELRSKSSERFLEYNDVVNWASGSSYN